MLADLILNTSRTCKTLATMSCGQSNDKRDFKEDNDDDENENENESKQKLDKVKSKYK